MGGSALARNVMMSSGRLRVSARSLLSEVKFGTQQLIASMLFNTVNDCHACR